MASRNLATVNALSRGLVFIGGTFSPNASSNPLAASNKGRGWSVARTGTGVFVITFTDKWVDLVTASATLTGPAFVSGGAQVGPWSNSAHTLTIWTQAGGTLADIAADPATRVHFSAWLSNTSVNNRGK